MYDFASAADRVRAGRYSLGLDRSVVLLISVFSQKTKGCEASQKVDSQNPFERRQEASTASGRSRRNKIPLGVGCFDLHLGAIAPGFASVLKCDTDGRVRMSLS